MIPVDCHQVLRFGTVIYQSGHQRRAAKRGTHSCLHSVTATHTRRTAHQSGRDDLQVCRSCSVVSGGGYLDVLAATESTPRSAVARAIRHSVQSPNCEDLPHSPDRCSRRGRERPRDVHRSAGATGQSAHNSGGTAWQPPDPPRSGG